MWSKTTQHFCQTQKKNIASSCNRVTKSTCDIFVRKFARFAIHPVFLAYKKQWFKSRLIGLFWISFIQTRSTPYWPICIFLRWVCINTYVSSNYLCCRYITLYPVGAENMSWESQVPDICFWKQNCIRNPKMGSKQSIPVPP